MNTYDILSAQHEASHLIMYLANNGQGERLCPISEISIQPKRKGQTGFIRVPDILTPKSVLRVMKGKPTKEVREFYKRNITSRIKFLLAGLAGECVSMGYDYNGGHPAELLSRFHKSDNEISSDLNIAIAFNTALGCQNVKEGALPLAAIFEETMREVKSFWPIVERVASQLKKERTISGDRLGRLVSELSMELNQSQN